MRFGNKTPIMPIMGPEIKIEKNLLNYESGLLIYPSLGHGTNNDQYLAALINYSPTNTWTSMDIYSQDIDS